MIITIQTLNHIFGAEKFPIAKKIEDCRQNGQKKYEVGL